MREHPDRETLKKFISGQLASEDARLIDRHLAVCWECRDRADEISEEVALQLSDSWLQPSYDEAFEDAASRAADRLASVLEEARDVEDLFAQLMQEPPSERRRKVVAEERFRTLQLSQFLRCRSQATWSSDPTEAGEMARLAVEVALHLDAGRYGSCLVEDARALAWGYLGNSLRINSDLWRSERALQQAWFHHAQSEDMLTATEILGFTSSLRIAQSLYDEAAKLSNRSIALCRRAHDHHREGAGLIRKGMILCYQGLYRAAIQTTQAGLEKIDPQSDARLVLAGKHNLICALTHTGAAMEARASLEQSRHLYQEQMDRVRLRWLEGLIARDLGDLSEVERALGEVREVFLDRQMGVEVFLVSFDLAQAYARFRHWEPVKEILSEIIPLGEALGLGEKTLMAKLLYIQAVCS